MKLMHSITLAFLASLLLFSACKNEPLPPGDAALAHIPNDAVTVMGIDLDRLMQKADFDEVKKMAFYQKMVNETWAKSPTLAAALEDPTASGIDLRGKIYMTASGQSEKMEDATSHIFVPLANMDAFEKILAEADVEFTTENGRKVSRPDANVQATWDDHMAVFSFAADGVDLAAVVEAIFALDENTSFAQNKSFRRGMTAEHDVVSFFSTNSFAKNPTAKVAIELANLDKDILDDNYVAGYADFEKGRMVGHADFLVNSSLGRGLVGRFFHKKVETDFSKIVPTGDLAFVMSAALDLRGIDQWLSERPQQRETVDLVVADFGGISRRELIQTLNGDVFVSGFSADLNDKENFIVGFGVKSKKEGKAFLDRAVAQKNLKEIEPGFYKVLGFGGSEFSIRVNKGIAHLLVADDVFVIAKDKDILEQIRRGETNGDALANLKNKAIGGWANLEGMTNEAGQNDMFRAMQFSADGEGADFIMNMDDPTGNSLKSLLKKVEEQYENARQKVDAEAVEM